MIDVLVLNYNDAMTTLNYVNKIKTYKNVRHILVVDNFSTDNSVQLLSDIIFRREGFLRYQCIVLLRLT